MSRTTPKRFVTTPRRTSDADGERPLRRGRSPATLIRMSTTSTSTSPGPALRVSLPGLQPSVKDFLTNEAGSAVYLLAATVVALVWANSPWADAYESM